ncbi:type II toxin-antitoxin system VapC family toxin [Rhodoferax sp.]|uniref:type II toxin-antitoxin system VapC family toxin n=1 Tax=Rhodoferax sp. TaxID=50421 RepID=UPI0027218C62|nr:type II toxin-antitoxin system VapC family toxin [Rhodoferax sp.]MDO9198331.1 type II toxin-antitoxin system VapC family toxin [Rhodoferax sp.]
MTAPNRYLLDTNILSDMMRTPGGRAAQQFRARLSDDHKAQMCTSVVVQCELLFGLRRRTHPRWQTHYERVLESVDVLPLESDIAAHYAQIRTALELAGTPIGPNDTLIAAHALALGATLVTADAEFTRVPGLRLENWLSQ